MLITMKKAIIQIHNIWELSYRGKMNGLKTFIKWENFTKYVLVYNIKSRLFWGNMQTLLHKLK